MGRSHGRSWSMEVIESELLKIIPSLGRMPSYNELVSVGCRPLAQAIAKPKYGGYRLWANKLGLGMKGTETHRGQAVEDQVSVYLIERGFAIQRKTTRASFDLLVNDKVRVDVKSAKFSEYRHTQGHAMSGHVFNLSKPEPTCDLYILCGVGDGNQVLWRYFVPASEARVQTITITPEGKYSRFREAIGELKRLVQ